MVKQKMSEAEAHLRRHLADPTTGPRRKESLSSDQEVYNYLKSLGTARSQWETDFMLRLKKGLKKNG